MKDDSLSHYGILGMKWGRRKANSGGGGSRSSGGGKSSSSEPVGLLARALGRKENFRIGRRKGESNEAFDRRVDKENAEFDAQTKKLQDLEVDMKRKKELAKKNPYDGNAKADAVIATKKYRDYDRALYNDLSGKKTKKQERDDSQLEKELRETYVEEAKKRKETDERFLMLRDRNIPKSERWAKATLADKTEWVIYGDPSIPVGEKLAKAAMVGVAYVTLNLLMEKALS